MRKALLKLALHLRRRNIYAEYDWLKKRCEQSLESNLAIQQERLKILILHASKNVPYYNELFRETRLINQGQVRLDQFQKVPALTRETLQTHYEKLMSQDNNYMKRKPYISSSGGSTGKPVRFIQDNIYWTRSNAVKWLFFSFASDYPCRNLSLWGSEKDILHQSRGFRARVGDFLLKRHPQNV